MELILASKSPRRIDLLKMMGLSFSIQPCTDEERIDAAWGPDKVVEALATQKAQSIYSKNPNCCVIGADTIVWYNGEVIGKPHSKEDAHAILKKLQGNTHQVYTGIAVITPNGMDVRHAITSVTFAPMSEQEINGYISTGEPMDKAGAYGMQGIGGVFVESVCGSSFNVIGMPIQVLYQMLKKAKVIEKEQA